MWYPVFPTTHTAGGLLPTDFKFDALASNLSPQCLRKRNHGLTKASKFLDSWTAILISYNSCRRPLFSQSTQQMWRGGSVLRKTFALQNRLELGVEIQNMLLKQKTDSKLREHRLTQCPLSEDGTKKTGSCSK